MNVYDIVERLPSIGVLHARCLALAVLERIVGSSEPYYSFTRTWGPDEAALMSNGSGDEWAIVFTDGGAFIRIFDHESAMSPYRDPDHRLWPRLLDGLPEMLRPFVDEPAFSDGDGNFLATAALWRLDDDDRWCAGDGIDFPEPGLYSASPDGTDLLEILVDDVADRYAAFASDYYEVEVDRMAIEHVVGGSPLTEATVRALNPAGSVAELLAGISALGYPVG